jgi:hypothetical protein
LLFASVMRRASAIVFACALLISSPPAHAVDPGDLASDVELELRAGMCDAFEGLSFTFCVALCEARACDRRDAADERCSLLRRGFARVAGGANPPCDVATATTAEAL